MTPQPALPGGDQTVASAVRDFLADLAHANRSPRTLRAYAADLAGFQAVAPARVDEITAAILRDHFASSLRLSPATRARKQAALSSFFAWAVRHERLAINPMARLERVRLADPEARGVGRPAVEAILAAIPVAKRRDRLLFRLLFETGVRVGEALAVHVEDLDLRPDDEHLRVLGKGNRRRTVLLDDPALVHQLRAYLKQAGYRYGPLFRAEKNGRGGPLRYQSVQELWARYWEKAGVACTLHQLRHTHATELVNDGVGLATIRKRLGHRQLQTTLRYADQSEQTADTELRAWRRRRGHDHVAAYVRSDAGN